MFAQLKYNYFICKVIKITPCLIQKNIAGFFLLDVHPSQTRYLNIHLKNFGFLFNIFLFTPILINREQLAFSYNAWNRREFYFSQALFLFLFSLSFLFSFSFKVSHLFLIVLKDLKEFAKNVYSQNGEDGIIEEILKRLNIGRFGVCCEFGAWDGINFSNTYSLVEKGWDAIYIESDFERHEELKKTAVKHYPRIHTVLGMVEPEGENSLDNILSKFERQIDVLSIDVDGIDYWIWKEFKNYHPKIVIIEVNSSVPPPIEQTHDETHQGSSFTSMLKLGNEKGYDLVCHTGNMIFVRKDLTEGLFEDMNSNLLFDDRWVRK